MPRTLSPAVAVALLAIPACHPHHDEHAHHGGHHTIVATSPQVRDVTVTQQYVGQIRSRRNIEVRPLQEGYLEAVTVREGQAVKAGDLLFAVVPTLYKTRVAAEQAKLQSAQLQYDNTSRLAQQNVVSQQEVALKQAELNEAKARLNQAETELAFTQVKAPFDGIIDRFQQQQGSLVKKEDVLTTLSDNTVMWVYFNVPETRYLEHMAGQRPKGKPKHAKRAGRGDNHGKGQEKSISVDSLPASVSAAVMKKYPDGKIDKVEVETEDGKVEYEIEVVTADGRRHEFEVSQDGGTVDDDTRASQQVELVLADGSKFPHPGTIGAIEAKFNNETGNIPFRADFPNPERLLRHGQTGNVLIHRTLKGAVVIPQRATFEILDKRYVFVVGTDGVVKQREITIQHEQDDIFLVGKGLAADERIVLEGVRQVKDGDKVECEFRKSEDALANQKHHAE